MAGVTNKDIAERLDKVHEVVTRLDERYAKVERHETVLYGNGQPGLIKDMNTVKTYGKSSVALLGIVLTILGVMQALTACQASSELQTAIDNGNTQAVARTTLAAMTPDYSETPYPTSTPTVTETQTPRPSLTPWTPVTVTPGPSTTPVSGVVEIDADAVQWLSRLCWVESRSFGEARLRVCANILSTVFRRTTNRELSAGSIYSTLTWNCKAGDATCQFPAWVTQDGCEGIVICPDFDEEGMLFYRGVVMNYLLGYVTPSCPNRLYYGNQPHDMVDCVIEGLHGEKEGFHD